MQKNVLFRTVCALREVFHAQFNERAAILVMGIYYIFLEIVHHATYSF
jgi:hypothetical protein